MTEQPTASPGFPQPAHLQPAHGTTAVELLLPISVSGWAMAAGYLGLLSWLILPGPISLVVGFIALRDLAKRPHMRGKVRAWLGVVMGAISTTLLGVFAILIATGH